MTPHPHRTEGTAHPTGGTRTIGPDRVAGTTGPDGGAGWWLLRAASVARLGQAHWFFGNVYEAMVDMPRLLADARSNRPPKLLGAGSPLRYYLPAAPVTLAATAATLAGGWRAGADRRVIGTAVVSTAVATALTAYLVRAVNLRLLRDDEPLSPAEARRLIRTWHRGNLARLLALAVAMWALRNLRPNSLPARRSAP